jgi:hypothetical protein
VPSQRRSRAPVFTSGLRNGNGLPVYLIEIGSMYLHSPSRRLDRAPTNLRLLIGIMKIDDGERDARITPGVLRLK